MDKIIKKIIEIDQRAVNIKKDTEKIIKNKLKEQEVRSLSIEKDNLQKAKEKGNKEYERIINEGEREAEEIIKRGEQKIELLEEVFDKKFGKMQTTIFAQLFTSND